MKIYFYALILVMLHFKPAFAQESAQNSNTMMIQATRLPGIFPTPVSIKLGQGSISLGNSVLLIATSGANTETVELLKMILKSAGVETITLAQKLPIILDHPYIIIGDNNSKVIQSSLERSNALKTSHAEGYTITNVKVGKGAIITLAAHDADGLFYAVQTFRQLSQHPTIPCLVIEDYPTMPIRGTIEGFYGKPWSMLDRTKHLKFLATVKANTYVYSPKDDPYARDRWREDYPSALLKELGTLVSTASSNHINFVYAISPGPSICFSDPNDLRTLVRKFDALRAIGVHSFYVALDDIEYAKWNCDRDRETFGASGPEAAGVAQAQLLNALQASISSKDPTAKPLIMVPTEYYDTKESPYKAALRKNLNPKIIVQWTGTDVVPPAISIGDARGATKAFGRKTLLWDNYPVNDYAQSAGRLLLAPYDRREAGLSGELSGILSNPMNQEAPSRIAVTGVAAFAWNDKGYDAERIWHAAARSLANNDEQATSALLLFFDTQHLAPTFGSQAWQKQSPKLKAILDKVREAIATGNEADRHRAIQELQLSADKFANAPEIIRAGTADPSFAQASGPWLDAMQLWGKSLQLTAAGLYAAEKGYSSAQYYFKNAKQFASAASAIQSIPGATRFDGPIKIADGVLDEFVADAPGFIAHVRTE